MTWLTFTEDLCHKLPGICSVCRNHNPVLSSFMTDHRYCFIAPETFNYLAFQCFYFERTWWRLYQKCVVHTKFDIHVCIVARLTRRVPLAEQEWTSYHSGATRYLVWLLLLNLVFCAVFCRSFLPFFCWPLYCLSLDLRLLITPLVSFGHCIVSPS